MSAPAAAGDLAADRSVRAGDGRDDAPLPGAGRLLAAAGQRQRHRPRRCARSPRSCTEAHPEVHRRCGDPRPHRGLQALAGRPARADGPRLTVEHPGAPAGHPAHVLPPASTSGTGRTGPSASRSCSATCPARTSRCPRRSTTRPPPSSCAPPRPSPGCWSASSARCCCAPACGSASSSPCKPTRSCRSAPGTGCTSRSASSTTTATCRCTRTWSTLISDYRGRHVHRGQPAAAAAGERQADRPPRRHPLPEQGRRGRRDRARPPAPDAPHPRHPGDQPGHVTGGDRRAARAPLAWT